MGTAIFRFCHNNSLLSEICEALWNAAGYLYISPRCAAAKGLNWFYYNKNPVVCIGLVLGDLPEGLGRAAPLPLPLKTGDRQERADAQSTSKS